MIAYQITLVRVDYFQTLFCNMQNFPANSKFSAAATFLAYSQAFIVPPLPFSPSWWDVRREWREAYRTALMTHFDLLLLSIYWRWIRNSLCWKSSLKVVHLSWGQFFDHHGMLYIISNLLKVAIWRSKDFRIRPLIAEKSTTLLFNGTLGHTVSVRISSSHISSNKKVHLYVNENLLAHVHNLKLTVDWIYSLLEMTTLQFLQNGWQDGEQEKGN